MLTHPVVDRGYFLKVNKVDLKSAEAQSFVTYLNCLENGLLITHDNK